MRRIDPPFPSFTLAMTKAQNFDPSRLPAYRSSYLERFHPYPRVAPRRPQDALMTTVDHRYGDVPRSEEAASQTRLAARCEETVDNDASALELDLPIVGAESEDEESTIDDRLSRSVLAASLKGLLENLQRRYLTVQIVRNFLGAKHAKRA